ncbi:S8 family peptidase [Ornithinimicrobium cavernae]|uniref:S8 family peptidase n=1 Tax=Ornithinimicrobium cavernae TaxID=2666047 RepID=UPI000D6966B6|nr:S8 family serine peptidase [Ornithinimicrobium cavernae]
MSHGQPRPVPRTRRRSLAVAAVAVVGTALGLAAPGAAVSPPSTDDVAGTTATSPDTATVDTVALVTGDRVRVTTTADGTHLATLLPSEDGTRSTARVVEEGEDVYVIPWRAEPHLASGLLDRELFNVTALRDRGTDSAGIPLIVEYAEASVSARGFAPAAPRHSEVTATLESIGAVAVEVAPTDADAFWQDLVPGLERAGAARTASAGGIARVWLDPLIEADLTESVPQIGAPTAWAAGFDGAGTTVAVLDTGFDPDHPDLAGQVVGSSDFSGTGIVDGHGHGTHVASTVAGTGIGSEAGYVGVAPGADLLIGKVMTNDGTGEGSWLIDAMEWAAAEGADVVNMSLSTEVTDGTDPISQAVNQLSAQTDTLFVATSGNTGEELLSTRAPGSADSALSVAAVDKADAMAWFSSRGPRFGDYALKPDLAAPGVDIVAARAAGTTLGQPVDDLYVAASGTSMAAPHIAGAAALLKQARPGWDGERLKEALMSSSLELTGASVYDAGSGRVDVARAVAQQVTATGSVSYGILPFTEAPVEPVTSTITYRNDGPTELTLDLALSAQTTTGTAAPDGMFTLGASSVTVPAGGSADVTLTLDGNLGAAALYDGDVTATSGDTMVHTVFGVFKEPDLVDVVIEGVNPDGTPAGAGSSVDLWSLDTDETVTGYFGGKGGPGPAVVTVPVGTYSLTSFLWMTDDAGRFGLDVSMVSRPEIELTEDTTIVLDARDAELWNPRTPQPTESRELTLGYHRASENHSYDVHYLMDRYVDNVYLSPTEEVARGEFEVSSHWELYAPEFGMSLSDNGTGVAAEYTIGSPRLDGEHAFAMVDAGTGTPEEVAALDLDGRLALIEYSDGIPVGNQVENVAAAGAAAAVVYYNQPGFFLDGVPSHSPIPSFTTEQGQGHELLAAAAEGQQLLVTATAESPYTYDLFPYYAGTVPETLDTRVRHGELARVDATYYSSGSTQQGAEILFPRRPHDSFVLRQAQAVAVPSQRAEWVTPGEVIWQPFTWATLAQQGGMIGADRSYATGERRDEGWFSPVLRPGVPSVGDADDADWGLPGYREGDQFMIQVRPLMDADEHFSERGGEQSSRLLADGELLAEKSGLEGAWPALAGDTAYRLELEADQHDPWWQHSTTTHTAWEFTSGRPGNGERELLDLLQVDYRVATDLQGLVPRGRPTTLGVAVYPQGRPAQAADVDLTLSVSYDDGQTWTDLDKVRPVGDGTFEARVRHPKGAEHVSLRVVATQDDGTSVEQTVLRAFGVGR